MPNLDGDLRQSKRRVFDVTIIEASRHLSSQSVLLLVVDHSVVDVRRFFDKFSEILVDKITPAAQVPKTYFPLLTPANYVRQSMTAFADLIRGSIIKAIANFSSYWARTSSLTRFLMRYSS